MWDGIKAKPCLGPFEMALAVRSTATSRKTAEGQENKIQNKIGSRVTFHQFLYGKISRSSRQNSNHDLLRGILPKSWIFEIFLKFGISHPKSRFRKQVGIKLIIRSRVLNITFFRCKATLQFIVWISLKSSVAMLNENSTSGYLTLSILLYLCRSWNIIKIRSF